MGSVFEARDPKLNRNVAIKLLHAPADVDGLEARRLLREARALARLSHPNVVEIYDVGMENGRVWLAMELVEGRTLKAWARANPPGTAEQRDAALELLRQAAAGLAAAHAASLTHRDFKPANVLVGNDGRVRVADFGLARTAADTRNQHIAQSPPDVSNARVAGLEETVTRTGAAVGTPRYMAPEQHRGETSTARTDQFGFAVTAWELLHGEAPFDASTTDGIYDAIVSRRFRSHRVDAVPRWMTRVLKRALAPRPWGRYRSMEALVRALDSRQRRQRGIVSGALGGLIATALASATMFSGDGDRAQATTSCVDVGGEAFDRVWDDELRASILSALSGTGVPYNRTAARTLDSRVERYRQDWTAAIARSCGEGGGAAPSALDCLYLDLRTLAGVLEGMRTMTAADAERIGSSLRGLPSPMRCADVEPSLWSRPRDAAFEEQLTAAEVALARREWETAERLAQDILDKVDESAWQTRLDALMVVGGARVENRWPAGLSDLEDAYHLASAHKADATAADAAWRLALGRSQQGERHSSQLWISRFESASAKFSSLPHSSLAALQCSVLERTGDFEGAAPVCERAVLEAVLGNDRVLYLDSANVLATVYRRLGRARDALEITRVLYRSVSEDLGPNHPKVGGMLLNLGTSYFAEGELEEAAGCANRARGVFRRVYGENSRWVVSALMNEARAYSSMYRYDAAEELLEEAIQRFEESPPIQKARVLNNLSSVRSNQGRYADALRLLARVEAIQSVELEADAPQRGTTYEGQAWVYFGLQRWREGVAAAAASIEVRERSGEVGSLISSLSARVFGYRALGDLDAAQRDVRRSFELAVDDELAENTRAWPTLLAAIVAFDVGNDDETERALDRASRAFSAVETAESERALIEFLRARLTYRDPRQRAEAIERALASFEIYERRPLLSYPVSEARAWLDSIHR